MLPASQFTFSLMGAAASRLPMERRSILTDKLRVLVRVDLDCAQARVAAQGHVTVQSVQALYAVMKRANSLMAGLALEIDMTHAEIDPDALEQLRDCSRSHHLPSQVDPLQSDYRFSVLAPDDVEPHGVAQSAASRLRRYTQQAPIVRSSRL